jgi:hypothetical protein
MSENAIDNENTGKPAPDSAKAQRRPQQAETLREPRPDNCRNASFTRPGAPAASR